MFMLHLITYGINERAYECMFMVLKKENERNPNLAY